MSDLSVVTDNALAALVAVLPATTAVGDGKPPTPESYPHVILYSGISTTEAAPSLSAGAGVLATTLQATCVGRTRKSREITAAAVMVALLDPATDLGSAEVRVSNRRLAGSTVDDDPDNHLFIEHLRISLWAAP
jgi:hypothetical protein